MFGSKKAERLSESPAIDAFFGRLTRFDGATFLAMAAEHNGIPEERVTEAREAAQAAADAAGVDGEIRKVQDRVLHWCSVPPLSPNLGLVGFSRTEPALFDARTAATPAVVEAAVAIALGDRLEPSAREVLLRPWHRALDAMSDGEHEAGRR